MQVGHLDMRAWRERLALAVVLMIVGGLPAIVLGYQFGVRPWLAGAVQEVLGRLDLRAQSPEEVYRWLAAGDASERGPLRDLSSAERWDVVAYLWRAQTSAARLEVGQRLYLTNCAACHGERGDGAGPAADLAQPHEVHGMAEAHGPRAPADFTDLRAAAGASDLVYYGKLVRGGMGTGMPYWGSIFTDEELWALVDYVRSFAFGGEESSTAPHPEGPS